MSSRHTEISIINYRLGDLNKGACKYASYTNLESKKNITKIFYNTLLFHPVFRKHGFTKKH